MRSKKLISLLCAASMAVTSFAAVVTAQAAADPVWTYDGSDQTGWSGSSTIGVTADADGNSYISIMATNNTQSDNTFTLPAEAQLTDDYVVEFDTMIHAGNGMGRLAQYAQVAFTGANPTKDTQGYGGDYAAAVTEKYPPVNADGGANSWNSDNGAGAGYAGDIAVSLTSRVELCNKWIVNYNAADAPSLEDGDVQTKPDEWVRVRAAVKDGIATVTIMNAEGTILDAQDFPATATSLNKIVVTANRGDANFASGDAIAATGPAQIFIDNIKVYSGIEGTPAMTTSGLRGAVEKAPEVDAPLLAAPEDTTVGDVFDFENADTTVRWSVNNTNEQNIDVIDNMNIHFGYRGSGADASTNAGVKEYANGKVLELNNGRFSNNLNGPRVELKNNLDISSDTSKTSVMAFAFRLDTDKSCMYVVKDATASSSGQYRNIMAAFVADGNGQNITRGDNGTDVIGIDVTPGEWHVATIMVSDNRYRVFVDDGTDPAVVQQYVATGDGASTVSALPMITAGNSRNSIDAPADYSNVLIDNMITYQGVLGEKTSALLPIQGQAPDPGPTEDPGATASPEPTNPPAEVPAPVLTAPEGVTEGVSLNFNSNDTATWSEKKDTAQSITDIDGMIINFADRENDTTTYAAVKGYAGGKILELQGGRWSNANRGPVIEFADKLSIAADNTKTTVLAFAANLSTNDGSGSGKLFLLKNRDIDGRNKYRNIMAVLTTGDDAESFTRGNNGTDVIGVQVTPNEWHTVAVMISSDKYRVFVDGSQAFDAQYVSTGESASRPEELPYIAVTDAQDSVNPPYSVAKIDNILTYQGEMGERASALLPTESIENIWTKYVAEYDPETGVVTSVDVTPNYEPTAEDANLPKGTFIWNQNLKPYVAE